MWDDGPFEFIVLVAIAAPTLGLLVFGFAIGICGMIGIAFPGICYIS